MNNTQPLLFDIPSLAETAVWATLTDGINPAEWAGACRYLGNLSPDQFQDIQKKLFPANKSTFNIIHSKFFSNPDSLFSRLKRVFCFNQAEVAHLPLVSIGPEGINA
jgi:hypothetical protein